MNGEAPMISNFRQKLRDLLSDRKFSEILTGSVWVLGARVASTILAMVSSIIIARCYGAQIMGIVSMIISFLTMATVFTVLGTNTSILRLIPEHTTKYSVTSAFRVYRKTQYFVTGVSVITGGILYWAADLIAVRIFSKPHLSFFFALSAVFVVFVSLMNLNNQAVRGLRLIKTFAFMQLLPSLSKLSVLIIITIFFFNAYNPVYALFASFLITALVGVLITHFEFKKKMRPSDIAHEMSIQEILSISLPMLMSSSMTFIMGQIGVIMLGAFRSDAEVGHYAVAVKLATLTAFVLNAVNTMAAPRFSELFHGGKMDELFYVAKKSAKLIFWATAPVLAILVLFGKPLLGLLFGPEFEIAYVAMVLLVLGQFANAVSGSTGNFMNMTGHQAVFQNIMVGAALLNISLNLSLIPHFGIDGAAIAGMTSLSFWNVGTLVFIKMRYGKIIGYVPLIPMK